MRIVIFLLFTTWLVLDAEVIVHETWADRERNLQDLENDSLAWFSSSATSSLTAALGAMTQEGGGRHVVAYFTEAGDPLQLDDGEGFRVEFLIRFNRDLPLQEGFFRMGLFDSGGFRVEMDGHTGENALFENYTGFTFAGQIDGSSASLRRRNTGQNSNLIGTFGAFEILGEVDPFSRGLSAGVPYAGNLNMKRIGDDVHLEFSIENWGVIQRVEEDTDYFNFDTLAFTLGTNIADSFTLYSVRLIHEIVDPGTPGIIYEESINVVEQHWDAVGSGFYDAGPLGMVSVLEDHWPWVYSGNLGWIMVGFVNADHTWVYRLAEGWNWASTLTSGHFYSLAQNRWWSPYYELAQPLLPVGNSRSTLYYHDGIGVYSLSSPHQPSNQAPVSVAQVNGFVDEAADAGMDILAFTPNLFLLPGWDSNHYPYWQRIGQSIDFEAEYPSLGRIFRRAQEMILSGQDLIQLTMDRTHAKGMKFYLSWRMSDSQYLEREGSPSASPFWTDNPHLRIGGASVPAGDGNISNRPLLALDFSHQEVREHKFGFIEELIESYDIDGFELDFLRFPYFFPKAMAFEDKASVMNDFVKDIRTMMNAKGKADIPLGVRVGARFEVNFEAGLDVHTWVKKGWVDYINVSSSMMTLLDNEMERYRAYFPDLFIFGEVAHIASHRRIDGASERWHAPREVLHGAAHSNLTRGADGISVFNYVYARSRGGEPDWAALQGIADSEFLEEKDKHYHLHRDGAHLLAGIFNTRIWSQQLPLQLSPGGSAQVSIPIADVDPESDFEEAFLRLFAPDSNISELDLQVSLNGVSLVTTSYAGELSQSVILTEGIPLSSDHLSDFVVPLDQLGKGWNTFLITLPGSAQTPIVIENIDLKLVR